jgi:4-amino-4-deoxy-L-arabinose transferase-like glycosyltransferase
VIAVLAVLIVVGGAMRYREIGKNQRVSADEMSYAGLANSIASGHGYLGQIHWAPGAPYVFALFSRLEGSTIRIGPHARSPAQAAQLVIGLATLVLAAFGAWWLAGPVAALLATFATAIYDPLILLTRTYLSEPLGGLTLLAMMLLASIARSRRLGLVALAGVAAGAACLTRNDTAIAIPVIAIALAVGNGRSAWRTGLLRGGVYVLCALVTITPWVIYSSNKIHQFVPITTAGPTALFVGTYLPAGGKLIPTEEAFRGPVCKAYPKKCANYAHEGSAPMFELLEARSPTLSARSAITKAGLHNLRIYALGRPLSYAGMLADKAWRMWGTPWGGGTSAFLHEASRTQHLLLIGFAVLGLFGAALVIRRWAYVVPAVVLLAVAGVNVMFVSEAREAPRMVPLLFVYGAAGLWALFERARARASWRARRASGEVAGGSGGATAAQAA